MDIETGLSRLATIVLWLGGLIAAPLAAGAFYIYGTGDHDRSDASELAVMMAIAAAGIFLAGWAIAWVIRGFAGRPEKRHNRSA